jgi:hypothetical protein
MIDSYLREGMDCLLFSLRPALLLYAGFVCLGWGKGNKIAIQARMLRRRAGVSWAGAPCAPYLLRPYARRTEVIHGEM